MRLGAAEEFYPQRPGEAYCIYYLRTGFCGYGSRYHFNHSCDRADIRFHCVRPMDQYGRLSEGFRSDPANVEAVGVVARARG
ncbi:Zinc finger CCCH domain-containing protein [Arachis hypogaea]|nr:Zinc finger CCCH domain-containing protein [Arachis hypogaea]